MTAKETQFEQRVNYAILIINELKAEIGKKPTHQQVIDRIKELGPNALVGSIDKSPELGKIVDEAFKRWGGRKLRRGI